MRNRTGAVENWLREGATQRSIAKYLFIHIPDERKNLCPMSSLSIDPSRSQRSVAKPSRSNVILTCGSSPFGSYSIATTLQIACPSTRAATYRRRFGPYRRGRISCSDFDRAIQLLKQCTQRFHAPTREHARALRKGLLHRQFAKERDAYCCYWPTRPSSRYPKRNSSDVCNIAASSLFVTA
jgi:hypothetical protein